MERATIDGKNVLLYKFSGKNYWLYDECHDEYIYKFKLSEEDFSSYMDKLIVDIYTPYMKPLNFKSGKYISISLNYYAHMIQLRVSDGLFDEQLKPESVYDYYILQVEV